MAIGRNSQYKSANPSRARAMAASLAWGSAVAVLAVGIATPAHAQIAGSSLRGTVKAEGGVTEVVRRQNIWHRSRRKLAECGPRLGVDVRRRSCSVASADIRWSVV